jgi:chromosome segregation ATPase
MCRTIETINECLGKPIFDPYGRKIGHIVSYYSDVDGRIKSLEINIGDFEYKEVSIERIRISSEGITMLPEYEHEALTVETRLKNIKSRLASLEELYSKKEIASHVYESLKKRLEEELTSVKTKAKEVKDMLRKRLHEVEEQIAEVEKSIGTLKTGYLAGEVNEAAYVAALDIMKKSIEVFIREKENIKKHLDKIEALEAMPLSPLIGLQQAQQSTQQTQPSQPINVVLVE